MKRLIVSIVLLGTAIGCASGGGGRGPGAIGERQQRQRDQIEAGARRGELNAPEELILREKSRQIDDQRRDARKDDGRIDAQERRAIKKQQKGLGEAIKSNRNDAETR
jgi:hypothetical protein